MKQNNIEKLAKALKVLAEPNRLRILFSLGLECVPVSGIIEKTGLSQTNVSFHLKIMRDAGIVKGDRRGAFVYYCLYDYTLIEELQRLQELISN